MEANNTKRNETKRAKQSNTPRNIERVVVAMVGGGLGRVGKMGDVGGEVRTSGCGMTRSWGCDLQHGTLGRSIVSAYLKLLGEQILKVLNTRRFFGLLWFFIFGNFHG